MANVKSFARNNSGGLADNALRAGAAGMSGGMGAGLRRMASAATEGAVNRGAERFANRLRNTRRGKSSAEGELSKQGDEKVKKMVGTVFWLVLSLTVFKDVSDVLADFSVILSLITPLTGIVTAFIVGVYFYYNKVEVSTNKIIAYVISLALEFIPFLNALPTPTIVLLLTKWMENNKDKVAKITGAVDKFKARRRTA